MLYLVLTLALTFPLVLHLGDALPGDSFDAWQNYWNSWWLKQSLVEQPRNPLFTDLLYHPTGVGLYFHTLNPFDGIVTLPLQLAGNLFIAYNAAVLLAFAAGGLGTYLLALTTLAPHTLAGRRIFWPAFTAGLIFTFAPYHLAHLLGHMQLIALQWIPFYLLSLRRGLLHARRGRLTPADWMRPGLFLILVGLCDWYYVLYCLIFSALALLAALISLPRDGSAWRGALLRTLAIPTAAGLVFGLALSPWLLPMARQAQASAFMAAGRAEAIRLSADLLAFVTPSGFHPLWGQAVRVWADRTFTGSLSEYTVFLGFVPLGLAALGLRSDWRRTRFWLLTALSFGLLALGPALHVAGRTDLLPGGAELTLPHAWLFENFSFMRIARSVSRYSVMVMLALGVLAAHGLAALQARRPSLRLLGPLLAGLVLFEFWPAPYPISPPDTPAWYQTLAQTSGRGAVLNLPMNWDRPGYLLYQTVHGRPLTVGYISRNDPRTLTTRAPVLQNLRALGPDILDVNLAQAGMSVLDWLQVEYVVLDFYKMPGEQERAPTTALAAAIFGDAAPVFADERLRVWRVEPPARRWPFPVLGEGWGERLSRDGTIWRALAPRATLRLVHGDQAAVLTLTVRGPQGTQMQIADPAGVVSAQVSLTGAWQTVSAPLSLANDIELTLTHTAAAAVQVQRIAVFPRD